MYHLDLQDNLQWADFFKHNSHRTVQRAQELWQFQYSKNNSSRQHMGSVIHDHTVLLIAAHCMG